jgi:hypothetical protein
MNALYFVKDYARSFGYHVTEVRDFNGRSFKPPRFSLQSGGIVRTAGFGLEEAGAEIRKIAMIDGKIEIGPLIPLGREAAP